MLEVELEGLWRTGEIQVTRPTIEAELQNALHYLREVFPEALARAHIHLREACEMAGFDLAEIDALPPLVKGSRMRARSWAAASSCASRVASCATKAKRVSLTW